MFEQNSCEVLLFFRCLWASSPHTTTSSHSPTHSVRLITYRCVWLSVIDWQPVPCPLPSDSCDWLQWLQPSAKDIIKSPCAILLFFSRLGSKPMSCYRNWQIKPLVIYRPLIAPVAQSVMVNSDVQSPIIKIKDKLKIEAFVCTESDVSHPMYITSHQQCDMSWLMRMWALRLVLNSFSSSGCIWWIYRQSCFIKKLQCCLLATSISGSIFQSYQHSFWTLSATGDLRPLETIPAALLWRRVNFVYRLKLYPSL